MKKIFIGVCNSQTKMDSVYFWSIISQVDFVVQPIFARSVHPSDIVRNNQLIDWFLKSDCDYFVKTDIDQSYPSDYFKVMVPLIEKYKVIGPLIFDRPYASNFTPLVNWLGKKEHTDIKGKTGIEEVPYLHTNCFFHREALEKIPPPWFEDRLSDDGLKRTMHVDANFMMKFPRAGYPVYINYDVVVKHSAEILIGREEYDRWNR